MTDYVCCICCCYNVLCEKVFSHVWCPQCVYWELTRLVHSWRINWIVSDEKPVFYNKKIDLHLSDHCFTSTDSCYTASVAITLLLLLSLTWLLFMITIKMNSIICVALVSTHWVSDHRAGVEQDCHVLPLTEPPPQDTVQRLLETGVIRNSTNT